MRKKRLLVWGVALAMAVCSLAGCGAGDSTDASPLYLQGEKIDGSGGSGEGSGESSGGDITFAGNAARESIVSRSVTAISLEEELQAVCLSEDKLYGILQTETGASLYVQDLLTEENTVLSIGLPDPAMSLVGISAEERTGLYYIGAVQELTAAGLQNQLYLLKGDLNGNIQESTRLQGSTLEWLTPVEKAELVRLADGQWAVLATGNSSTDHLLDQSLDYNSLYAQAVANFIALEDLYHTTTNVMKFDGNGNSTGHLQAVSDLKQVYAGLVENEDGLWTLYADQNAATAVLQRVDTATWQASAAQELTIGEDANCLLAADGQNTLLISDGAKLLQYHTDTGSLEELFAWADVGLNGEEVEGLQVSGDRISVLVQSWDMQRTLYLIQSGTEEKTVLTLGTVYDGPNSNPQFTDVINAYNIQSQDYYIQLVDYAESVDSYDTALEKFQMDLMTGNGTDLIDLTGMSRSVLGAAGLLTDLWEFQTDAEWQSGYVTEVLNCTQEGEALYAIGPTFNFYILAANGAKGVSEGGWTFEEMVQFLEKNGKGPQALGNIGWEDVMVTLGRFALDDYIDWQTGKADFQQEEFYSMLEFAKEASQSSAAWAGSTSEEIADGTCLASFEFISQVADYQVIQEKYQGQAVLKGFPCSEGTGITIQLLSEIGVNAGSDQQEAAWDFLQFYLANYGSGGFSIRRPELETQLQDAMTETYDAFGERVPKAASEDAVVYAATESEVNVIRNLISQADRECTYDTVILQIISEEAGAYGGSDMTAEKIAENIQKRVQLYLDEIR